MSDKKLNTGITDLMPFPACFVDADGKVTSASPRIGDVFLYDGIVGSDIFALTGIKDEQLRDAAKNGGSTIIQRNDRSFRVIPSFVNGESVKDGMGIYFMDVTDYEDIESRYEKEKACIAVVNIDNYNELLSSTAKENQAVLSSEIDKKIRFWAAKMRASVTRVKQDRYIAVFEKKYFDEQARSKFSILDEVRDIETEADFPVTLSIGIGFGGESPEEDDTFSMDALMVALGRGGDQVVVKNGNKIYYYGGKTQTVEKGNKGKSRIIGFALKKLIEAASTVAIMGHANPDMDSFGAALGIYRLSEPLNKDTFILVNDYNEALDVMYSAAKDTGDYNLINNKSLDEIVKPGLLLVVVDTHRPSLTECPELFDKADKVVVIDHHRKAEESIDSPSLSYQEPYASSTSELVAEILEYTVDRKQLTRLEAEGMLAGIMVDTNRFSVKTGVRTFEAAAWLKRAGADTGEVKKFFQTDKETFLIRANCVAQAEFTDDGIGFSICQGENNNAQIINSQVADELLTVRGVTASFVSGKDEHGRTVISARSLGEINVQVIMEKFGGGGHLTTAGAQVKMSPEEAINKIKELLEKRK